jgi:4-hydroxybenzoate polyprenyltransferase
VEPRLKLATALRLGRVSNLPTVWSNVLAGSALAGWRGGESVGVTLVCVALSLLYVGGMFLNDAFDASVDALERPERPIPSRLAGRTEVFGWGAALLVAGIGLAFTLTNAAGLLALATSAMIVLYDLVHKRTALAPGLMGACRVGVYFTAALAFSEPDLGLVALGSGVLFAYVLALTYAAAKENSTALVRIGPLVGLLLPLLIVGPRLTSALGFTCLLIFAAWTVYCTRQIRMRIPMHIRRGIGGLIAGISLLDALWLSAAGASPYAICSALAAFVATLILQRYVAGT